VLGPSNTVMELMRDEFLLEHSLFSRRLDFFLFKLGKGQSMSDAMNDLQRLGDQSDLGELHPVDLYVMQYLTITDDSALLEKLLEVEAPTQQTLKDATRHFETAERTKKTLSGSAAMSAYTELGVGANVVGRAPTPTPTQEQKLGNLGSETRIFHIPRNSANRFWSGTTQESFAPSAVIIRRKVRNMLALLVIPRAKSASALVTLTRIVLPIGSHHQRHARYLDKVSEMLTILAYRYKCHHNFQILSLTPGRTATSRRN
jgi:hypothetical protein